MEKAEAVEGGRDDAAEAVGVEVEEGEVSEEAELGGQVPGDVRVVEVDAGDDAQGGVGRRRGAVYAEVGADAGADPVAGQVLRVREDGRLLPRLKGNVGLPKPRVGELEPGIDRDGAPGGSISGVSRRREGGGAEAAAQQEEEEEEEAADEAARRGLHCCVHGRTSRPETVARTGKKRYLGEGINQAHMDGWMDGWMG